MTKTIINAAIDAIDDEACRLTAEAQYAEYLLSQYAEYLLSQPDDETAEPDPEDAGPGRCTIAEYDAMLARRKADLEADRQAKLADRQAELADLQHRLDAALDALYDCSIQYDYAACPCGGAA